ncbi:TPA: carbon storage regulator [Patescibacteria group bacterium]|nr:carbon storage regulator [Patescibacteria group bacterium]|tara:strand:- start:1038 stop:1229 length:192 start_codon:yes stop_codon:yes gene_type:complete
MLVLSRKKNEKIIIGENIIITVVDLVGEKVCIGIDAPADISIHRKEVQDAIDAETKENKSCKE